ncbi:MAG TPA: signal peptidase II [Ignavibacteriaceae bacterium]|nr:signal peptidase II [Ignavibacteriaceae bacterium]
MKVLYLTFSVLLFDQITKLFVKGFSIPFLNFSVQGMSHGQKIALIDNVLNITFIENPGIAFGIDFGADFKMLITIITIAASIGLSIYMFFIRKKKLSIRLSAALILGGALGNLVDRSFYGIFYGYAPLLHGKVVDFINIRVFDIYIFNKVLGNYIFNIADLAVTAGVVMLLISYSRERKENVELQSSLNNYLAGSPGED